MKIDNKVVAGIVAVVGYLKYKKFEDFINNLQLGLEVLDIDNGYANVSIKNLNTRHIPYSFESVDLIIDKVVHAATNTEKSTNLSIVPFSKIPINFKMQYDLSKQELEQSQIAIKYNFLGFIPIERLYTPKIVVNNSAGSINQANKSCGCKH